jgi:hypothetical protein
MLILSKAFNCLEKEGVLITQSYACVDGWTDGNRLVEDEIKIHMHYKVSKMKLTYAT